MKKYIAEELPATKHTDTAGAKPGGDSKPQSGKPQDTSGRTVEGDVEKNVRQAIYDIRYRARREGISLEQAYAQYIQNSNLSQDAKTKIREALFPRGEGESGGDKEEAKECYTSHGIELATDSVSRAMQKVFIEGYLQKKYEEDLKNFYEGKSQPAEKEKKSVKVTDKRSGISYYRTVDAKKFAQLKANPNLEVVYSEYGEKTGQNYEGSDSKKGDEKKVSESLDPVGQEDDDVDNDRRPNTKSDKYILKRRGAIATAIAKRKAMKEQFIGEVTEDQVDPSSQEPPIDVMRGKNKVKVVSGNDNKIFESSLEKFLKSARDRISGVCPTCGKCPCECDTRDRSTEMNLLKNKVRSMGIKNPIIMDPPKGKDVMKVMTSSAKMDESHVFKESDNLPVTAYTKGDRYPKNAGAMTPDEIRRANQGVSGRVRENIKLKEV